MHCRGLEVETVKHVLIDCLFYRRERHILQQKLRRNATSLPFLLSNPVAVKHALTFARSTGRFASYEETKEEDCVMTNARRNAELIAGARALGLLYAFSSASPSCRHPLTPRLQPTPPLFPPPPDSVVAPRTVASYLKYSIIP
jgi:hypothetical protein